MQQQQAQSANAVAVPALGSLKLGRSGSADEQAADRAAEAALAGGGAQLKKPCSCAGKGAPCGGACGGGGSAAVRLQRSAVSSATAGTAPASVHNVLRQPGVPLGGSNRAFMESRFGTGFGDVRIHTNADADRSSRAVGARAYTVGNHVVFRNGHYSPSPHDNRLLAHELAHVVQQRGGSPVVQRDDGDVPSPDGPSPEAAAGGGDVSTRADTAELLCDVSAICALSFSNPEVMTPRRVRAAITRCRPGVLLGSAPCLQPNIALPMPAPAAPLLGPRRARTMPNPLTPGTAPPASSSGGLNLSQFTQFDFSLGPANFHVSLPSSLRGRLPVEIRGATRITFGLDASTSGSFRFSATLDGIPHITIEASAGVSVPNERAEAGLTFRTTRTVCRVTEPSEAKEKIKKSGEKLKKSIDALHAPATGADPTAERLSTMADVASAIADMYKAADSAKGPCREVPLLELQLGGRHDFGQPDPTDPSSRPESFVGATLRLRF